MQTILGAGGPVSNALAAELAKTNEKVRLVSRRELKPSGNTSWKRADLLNYNEVLEAVRGSKVIYLCAGLKYDKDVWEEQWPVIIQNVINVTKETEARLIFFDNVYMYGLTSGAMTEDTPYNPSSRKGEIRSKVATQLMEEVKVGNIRASIARAADFYGATDSMNSFFDMMVLDRYSKKQKAQWMGDPATLHSFTFVPDAAKGVALLGRTPASDNKIWHLPTAPAMTGRDFIKLAARIFETQPRYSTVNKLMLRIAGLFSTVIKGTIEMYYQYQYDYNFNSSRFEREFDYRPTSYEEGLSFLYKNFYSKRGS